MVVWTLPVRLYGMVLRRPYFSGFSDLVSVGLGVYFGLIMGPVAITVRGSGRVPEDEGAVSLVDGRSLVLVEGRLGCEGVSESEVSTQDCRTDFWSCIREELAMVNSRCCRGRVEGVAAVVETMAPGHRGSSTNNMVSAGRSRRSTPQ